MSTQAEARALLCPFMTKPGQAVNCEAAHCIAWRWSDPEPRAPQSKIEGPDIDLLPGEPEPSRPEKVPAHWPWIALTITGEGDDEEFEGGYWEEPEEDRAGREAAIIASRRGYCGLVGKS